MGALGRATPPITCNMSTRGIEAKCAESLGNVAGGMGLDNWAAGRLCGWVSPANRTKSVCFVPENARAEAVLAFGKTSAEWGVPIGTPLYVLEHLRIRAKCLNSLGFIVDSQSSVHFGTQVFRLEQFAPQARRLKLVSGLARGLHWYRSITGADRGARGDKDMTAALDAIFGVLFTSAVVALLCAI